MFDVLFGCFQTSSFEDDDTFAEIEKILLSKLTTRQRKIKKRLDILLCLSRRFFFIEKTYYSLNKWKVYRGKLPLLEWP